MGSVALLLRSSIISFFFNPILLPSAHAQPQIGEKTIGFITSTPDGKRIALKDYWEQQGRKVVVLSFASNSLVPILPAGYGEINLNCYTGQLEPLQYLQ